MCVNIKYKETLAASMLLLYLNQEKGTMKMNNDINMVFQTFSIINKIK